MISKCSLLAILTVGNVIAAVSKCLWGSAPANHCKISANHAKCPYHTPEESQTKRKTRARQAQQ